MLDFLSNPNFLSFLCGAAAFAVVILIWSALLDRDPLEGRLKSIAARRSEFEGGHKKKNTRRAALQRVGLMKQVVEWFRLSQGKSLTDIRIKLRRAGIHSRDAIFVFLFLKLALMAAIGATAVFFLIIVGLGRFPFAVKMAMCLAGAIVGWMIPDVFIKNKSQGREEVLRKSIPDALDLMVICAEAGLSLDASFDRVSREVGPQCPELAEEIGLTGVELSFLPDRQKALHGFAERVPIPSIVSLVNTLIQTEKYGTPLAQALRVLSGEMREERMMKAEEKAAKLPAILTVPMILFILPPLFVVLIGPAIVKVLTSLSHGHH